MHLKISSPKWRPSCLGLNALSGKTPYTKSHEVPKLLDWLLKLTYHSEIWQGPLQNRCWDTCMISDKSDKSMIFLIWFHINVIFPYETGLMQWIFSQHCGYWWTCTLAPGLQCWVCTHTFIGQLIECYGNITLALAPYSAKPSVSALWSTYKFLWLSMMSFDCHF